MSSTFTAYVGPYAEWLVPGKLTVTWESFSGDQQFEAARACVWTEELGEIVASGGLGLNIGMNGTPPVLIRKVEYYRVCGFPGVGPGGKRGRTMAWSDSDDDVLDLTAVDRRGEIAWFKRTFKKEMAVLTEYFQTSLSAVRWGYVCCRQA
jgi:hypothetical protein